MDGLIHGYAMAFEAGFAVDSETPTPPYFLNGEQPPILGEICEGFYLQQYQEHQQVVDPANVAYLKFKGSWIRLYFDGDTIFWRESGPPTEPVNSGVDSGLVLVNLCEMSGVVGARLDAISCSGSEHFIEAALSFSSGRTLTFQHFGERDVTIFDC